MKTLRYLGILLMTICLASCEEQYTPGEPENENSWGIYFGQSEIDCIIGADSPASIDLTVLRSKTEGEVTVPLYLDTEDTGLFSAPENITFKDGESEVTVTVSLGQMEYNTSYVAYLDLPIDAEYIHLYNPELATSFKLSVTKEDYQTVATGTYTSGFFTIDDAGTPYSLEAALEYSELLGIYRLKDIYEEDYHITFTWDGGGTAVPTGRLATGYVHPSYGMYYISCETIYYDSDAKTFSFPWTWSVSAGTLGSNVIDTFLITEEVD